MEIIDPKSKTALVKDGDTYRREHDSERVMKLRNMLNATLQQLMAGWANDMAHDPTGATKPDVAAIRAHYEKRWMEQCSVAMNSADPVELDLDAMTRYIDRELAQKERERNYNSPLHAIVDLEPMGFRLAGLYDGGQLWLSTECAVLLQPGGNVRVYLRSQRQHADVFVGMVADELARSYGDLEHPDYTLRELMGLLQNLRRQRPAWPSEAVMQEVREKLAGEAKPILS